VDATLRVVIVTCCSQLQLVATPPAGTSTLGSSVNELEFNPLVKKMWSIIFINIVLNVSHKHTHGKGKKGKGGR